MNNLRILCRREWRRLVRLPAGWMPLAAGIALFTLLFAQKITQTGQIDPMAVLWSTALLPALALSAALLASQCFCFDRESGLSELMASTAIPSGQIVLSKYLPLVAFLHLQMALTLTVPLLILPRFGSQRLVCGSWLCWGADALLLGTACALLAAIVLLVSILFKSRSACTAAALVICCGLPLAAGQILPTWFPDSLARIEWFSPYAQLGDAGTGLLHLTHPLCTLLLASLLLRYTIVRYECLRLRGRL